MRPTVDPVGRIEWASYWTFRSVAGKPPETSPVIVPPLAII